jgi:predicted methyltransferase
MINLRFWIIGLSALALAACGGGDRAGNADQHAVEAPPPDNGTVLDEILAGDHRSSEERARDQYRHPKETLQFFEVTPEMSVVEIWPGGGWYTQVIAPYLKTGGGVYYAAGFSKDDARESVVNALNAFEENYVAKPEIYGNVKMTVLGDAIAPEGAADVVLTFRNIHNWMESGTTQDYFAEFYSALKPGGVLGVVTHRADGTSLPHDGSSGYTYTDDVIALAQAAGFEFEAASEINANAKDTKDHPFGVWTLPPVRRSSEIHGVSDPDFNPALYDAIGESDRMTLKFRKSAPPNATNPTQE